MVMHNSLHMALEDLKILILEDNLSMAKIYKNILSSFGVRQMEIATTVSEAQELTRSLEPDLIIVDHILSKTNYADNGLKFVKWLKQVEMAPLCFTPVLVATGHASRRVVLEYVKYGSASVVVKPISPTILHQKISSILSDSRQNLVEAGRIVIEGSMTYSNPKKKTQLVYDPNHLKRMAMGIKEEAVVEKKQTTLDDLFDEPKEFDDEIAFDDEDEFVELGKANRLYFD